MPKALFPPLRYARKHLRDLQYEDDDIPPSESGGAVGDQDHDVIVVAWSDREYPSSELFCVIAYMREADG